jgi:molecular chaperone Hsp33
MIQSLPLEPQMVQDEIHGAYEEDWNRAKILLDTVTEAELTDPRLSENSLLMRLFHEEGVRVYDPLEVRKGCRCTMDKLRNIIAMMPVEDQADMVVDGKITLTCEFCNKDFVFEPGELVVGTEDDAPLED